MGKPLDPDIQAMLDERKRTMADFTPNHRHINMYAIFRSDIEMPPEKLAALAGHAYVNAHKKAEIARPEIVSQYPGTGEGTKLLMWAKNLDQLIRAYRDLQTANIPHHLVIDRGHVLPPDFTGDPIITCIGIGPVYRDEVERITKRYRLFRYEKKNGD